MLSDNPVNIRALVPQHATLDKGTADDRKELAGITKSLKNVEVKPSEYNPRQAVVSVGPLERGFGITLGNALRRVLLSSLQGAAITAIQIQGVVHEFSSIPGVREDVTDLVLNIKGVSVLMQNEGRKRLRLQAEGPATVTAGMIPRSC